MSKVQQEEVNEILEQYFAERPEPNEGGAVCCVVGFLLTTTAVVLGNWLYNFSW